MSNFLYKYFTKYHSIAYTPKKSEKRNNYNYFEIDDISRNIVIHNFMNNGMSKYVNRNAKEVVVIDYDKFLTDLPNSFHTGKERCDLIVFTNSDKSYFILNELKDRVPKTKVRKKAKSQLLSTLTELNAVPQISLFINSFTNKFCCYSNKQPIAPVNINAVNAFNRISNIAPNGIILADVNINALGFTFMELKGNQSFKIT